MHNPDSILTTLRDYVRHRAPEVGFHCAMQEISDAMRQLRLFGSAPHRHRMVADATRRSAPTRPAKSVGPLL